MGSFQSLFRTKLLVGAMSFALLLGILPISVQAETDRSFQVSILHTNDIHGRVESNDGSQILGLERVRTLKLQKESEVGKDEVLLLDAGDYYHGQSVATLDKGASVAALLKATGYDAMTAGNHDWNYGKDRLKELEQLSGVPVVTGNVVNQDDNAFFDQKYFIQEVKNESGESMKIGVFGVIDPAIYHSTAPANVEGLTFTDMENYAKKAVGELKAEGCQVIVALAHCIDPAALAAKVDDVDLWVAGHEHSSINKEVTTPDGDKTLVVETGYYLWTIGNVDLECTLTEGGEVESLTLEEKMISYNEGTAIEKDAEITQLFQDIKAEQEPILAKEVAVISEDLEGGWEAVRIGETTLGRAITHGYLKATGADVAFENAGGIRASIKAGSVTYGDVLNVAPYGNYVVTLKLTGAELLSMMETSLDIMQANIASNEAGEYDGWVDNSGSVYQLSGMKIKYDPTQEKGSRIQESEIGGEPLDEEKEYVVAMNNYMATNVWDYPELEGKAALNEYGACEDILAEYLAAAGEELAADIHEENLIELTEPEDEGEAEEPGDVVEPGDTEEPEDMEKPEDTEESEDGLDDVTEPADTEEPEISEKDEVSEAPKTGDNNQVGMYVVMMCIACITMIGTRVYKKK